MKKKHVRPLVCLAAPLVVCLLFTVIGIAHSVQAQSPAAQSAGAVPDTTNQEVASDKEAAIKKVKQAIDGLIKAGTTFDVDSLDRIYHANLKVIIIDESGKVSKANKAGFKGLFETKKAAGDPPLNTWANYNDIEVHGTEAHVLITRKVKLGEEDQRLVLSIDVVFEDQRWQVIREVIFARPAEDK